MDSIEADIKAIHHWKQEPSHNAYARMRLSQMEFKLGLALDLTEQELKWLEIARKKAKQS